MGFGVAKPGDSTSASTHEQKRWLGSPAGKARGALARLGSPSVWPVADGLRGSAGTATARLSAVALGPLWDPDAHPHQAARAVICSGGGGLAVESHQYLIVGYCPAKA